MMHVMIVKRGIATLMLSVCLSVSFNFEVSWPYRFG